MFKRYVKIQNLYQAKYIYKFKEMFPDLDESLFIVQEKIDGGNISIIFTPQEEKYQIAKRSAILGRDSSIFDIKNWIGQYDEKFKAFQILADAEEEVVRIYGEAFGQGIQNRVHYGEDKYFLMYDMMIGDEFISQSVIREFLFDEHIIDLYVPVLAVVHSLTRALELDIRINSRLSSKKDNLCEGVVIKSYTKVIQSNAGQLFYIKKKNDEFFEKPAKKRERDPIDADLLTLQTSFRSYINDNRVKSLFSKEGEIDDPSQMGNYIKLILEDAKEDFLADDENQEKVDALEKKEQKIVFNVSRDVVTLLRAYL